MRLNLKPTISVLRIGIVKTLLLVLIILLLIALAEASTLVVVIRLSSLVLLMEYSSEYSIFNLLTPLERDRNRFLSNFVVRQNK